MPESRIPQATVPEPLARSLDQLQPSYDVVVVGSGYGGGVAACRLAEAGFSVCVLERGREFHAGEFSNDWRRILKEVRFSGRRVAFGPRSGLYDFRLGRDIHVLTASGLGGGSLINGAVALRPDPGLFAGGGWPEILARDGLFDQGCARAERMLGVGCCPDVAGLARFHALERAAKSVGARIEAVPSTITYRAGSGAADGNGCSCALCGDCWSGCNTGAKNTVAGTYLARAARAGAAIFALATVRHVSRSGQRWTVHLEPTGPPPKRHKDRGAHVSADVVILAAGTLGSTEVLLRSRERGLPISDRLGKGFSGNGDDMLIGRDLDTEVNAVAVGFPPKADVKPVGPATVAMIRCPGDGEAGAEVLLQDGTMMPLMAMMAPLKAFKELDWRRALKLLSEGPYRGYRSRAQLFYAITHDGAGGEMRLENDRLVVAWPEVGNDPCFARGKHAATRMIEALGGVVLSNPLSDRIFGGRKITVHPLGGCAMGTDAAAGVVDDGCRVFDPSRGLNDVHDGLYVCDGSIVRTSLGVNPLLTITALAERAIALLISQSRAGREQRQSPTPRPHQAQGAAAHGADYRSVTQSERHQAMGESRIRNAPGRERSSTAKG